MQKEEKSHKLPWGAWAILIFMGLVSAALLIYWIGIVNDILSSRAAELTVLALTTGQPSGL